MSDIGTWNDDTIGNLVARLVVQHNIRFDASAAIFDALEMVRDDLQQRIAQLEAENASLREQLAERDNVQGALSNVAWELSTWAASINWHGAQTSAWYQGLEKRIADVQGLCRITKGADNE